MRLGTKPLFTYLKAKRTVIQLKLGDKASFCTPLDDISILTNDWAHMISRVFSDSPKPTLFIQKISNRLLDYDYTEWTPSFIFIKSCLLEYLETQSKQHYKNGTSKKSSEKPTPPPRPAFDLMQYAKFPKKIPKVPPQKCAFIDEELHFATAEESPQTAEKPKFYSIPSSADWRLERESLESRLEESQRYIAGLLSERDQVKEALEEAVEFCDTVNYEHDLLLMQNSRVKKLLALLTDKLANIDLGQVNDIDFSDVLNDPCRDIQSTGILRGEEESHPESC